MRVSCFGCFGSKYVLGLTMTRLHWYWLGWSCDALDSPGFHRPYFFDALQPRRAEIFRRRINRNWCHSNGDGCAAKILPRSICKGGERSEWSQLAIEIWGNARNSLFLQIGALSLKVHSQILHFLLVNDIQLVPQLFHLHRTGFHVDHQLAQSIYFGVFFVLLLHVKRIALADRFQLLMQELVEFILHLDEHL